MKTKLLVIVGLLFLAQITKAGSPFYYERISNPSKTINFTFGFYHTLYSVSRTADDKEYIAVSAAVINESDYTLNWNNYHVAVLLKSGKLVINYLTAATSGEYACEFKVESKATYHTKFCFHTIFRPEDIQGVYLIEKLNMSAFDLQYSPNN